MAPTRGASSRTSGKRGGDSLSASASKKPRQNGAFANGHDGEVSEDDNDSVLDSGEAQSQGSEDEGDFETTDEARLRMAKEYLSVVEQETAAKAESDDDVANLDHDAIAHRLQRDAAEAKGQQFRFVAEELSQQPAPTAATRLFRGHKLAVTCVALTGDERTAYSASKDGVVLQWDVQRGSKQKIFPDSKFGPAILALAVSTDGRFVAMGGKDAFVHVYDAKEKGLVHSFKGHRDTISALAFRRGSHQLFSGSHDRTIKVWDLDEMCYVETLFGHQSEITGLASLVKERCVSAGRDMSMRQWKIIEESQLIFRGHSAAIDCVAMSSEEWFCGGSADGGVSLWKLQKKKPSAMQRSAHGRDANGNPNWVSAVAALPYSDLIASGSCDGTVRLWRCSKENARIEEVRQIPVTGFVNALCFAGSGQFLLVGVGQEHRLGRWQRNAEARNGVMVVPLTDNASLFPE